MDINASENNSRILSDLLIKFIKKGKNESDSEGI